MHLEHIEGNSRGAVDEMGVKVRIHENPFAEFIGPDFDDFVSAPDGKIRVDDTRLKAETPQRLKINNRKMQTKSAGGLARFAG